MSALLRNHLLNEPYTHLKSQPTALSTFPTLPCFLRPLHASQLVYQQLTNHGYSCFFSQSSWIVKRLPSTQNSTQDKAGAPSILPERSSVNKPSEIRVLPTTTWALRVQDNFPPPGGGLAPALTQRESDLSGPHSRTAQEETPSRVQTACSPTSGEGHRESGKSLLCRLRSLEEAKA